MLHIRLFIYTFQAQERSQVEMLLQLLKRRDNKIKKVAAENDLLRREVCLHRSSAPSSPPLPPRHSLG